MNEPWLDPLCAEHEILAVTQAIVDLAYFARWIGLFGVALALCERDLTQAAAGLYDVEKALLLACPAHPALPVLQWMESRCYALRGRS